MSQAVRKPAAPPFKGELILGDDFSLDQSPGKVIGSPATDGHNRNGLDVEKVISIDNGAIRIAPLLETGFGRAVLSYGPFKNKPGLAFSVYLLNGHNTAQAEPLFETFYQRLDRWLRGSETDPRRQRIVRWLLSGRVRRTLRQIRIWKRTAKGERTVELLDENLAVGWFPSGKVSDPRLAGNTFIMHALGPENGELWAGGVADRTRAISGVQNLPLYLVTIIRAAGVIYYIASLEAAVGMAPYPMLRPVAIDRGSQDDEIYLGLQQSVMGQIGFRMDSRVYGVRVAQFDGYQSWCSGAHAADRINSRIIRDGALAEAGGRWRKLESSATRKDGGDQLATAYPIAVLEPDVPSGLIHATVFCNDTSLEGLGLVWRFFDVSNLWSLELNKHVWEIICTERGVRHVVKAYENHESTDVHAHRLQVLDEGERMMAYIDGLPVTSSWIKDARHQEACGVGVYLNELDGQSTAIQNLEAHPRQIQMPELLEMGSPWLRTGKHILVSDDFTGECGDLAGRVTTIGRRRWSRLLGKGVIQITGDGAARIVGNVANPCPGRTAYCVDWDHPDYAELEVTITPPGTEKGQREHCTAGFILYQDMGNYVTLNIWRSDSYEGASISTFFKIDGFEDIYDAIWTNVGKRIVCGKPVRLRLSCDGEKYCAYVNDEPVLYRAFRDVYARAGRLKINKVGIIANWEWGRDTGSIFRDFCARI